MAKDYKILSLDGGGAWALIQAKALKKIFGDISGREILSHFDLVVANSGGSIVAAGMAEGYKIGDIEDLFLLEHIRKSIFAHLPLSKQEPINWLTRIFGIGPKYLTKEKYNGLQKVLPKLNIMPLTEVPAHIPGDRNTQFLVTAYDYYRNRAKFFRSNLQSGAKSYNLANPRTTKGRIKKADTATFVQAVHSATNAPLNFFNEPAVVQNKIHNSTKTRYFWDGAVGGYNNPVLAGVIEAMSNGIAPQDMHILSIGTGIKYLPKQDTFQTAYEELVIRFDKPTFINDLLKMTKSVLSDPPDAATYISYTILEPTLPTKSNRFIRISPVIQPSLKLKNNVPFWDVPSGFSFEQFRDLLELEMDATSDIEVELIDQLASNWLIDNSLNQPIRNNNYLQCLLGHNTFGEAHHDLKTWLHA